MEKNKSNCNLGLTNTESKIIYCKGYHLHCIYKNIYDNPCYFFFSLLRYSVKAYLTYVPTGIFLRNERILQLLCNTRYVPYLIFLYIEKNMLRNIIKILILNQKVKYLNRLLSVSQSVRYKW